MKELNKISAFSADVNNYELEDISINLPLELSKKLSRTAYENARNGIDRKSVSAIVRQAYEAAGYKSKPMKAVPIYSVGSCDTDTRLGTAESLLEYNGKTKYLYQQLQDTTANRCIIEGLIAGVHQLKEPCCVLLVTATKIGVKKAIRGKGVNAELVGSLIKDLQERECVFDFEVREGRGDELRAKVVAGRSGPAKYLIQLTSVQPRED